MITSRGAYMRVAFGDLTEGRRIMIFGEIPFLKNGIAFVFDMISFSPNYFLYFTAPQRRSASYLLLVFFPLFGGSAPLVISKEQLLATAIGASGKKASLRSELSQHVCISARDRSFQSPCGPHGQPREFTCLTSQLSWCSRSSGSLGSLVCVF